MFGHDVVSNADLMFGHDPTFPNSIKWSKTSLSSQPLDAHTVEGPKVTHPLSLSPSLPLSLFPSPSPSLSALLTEKEVDFLEIDVSDKSLRDAMIEQANGRRTVPQIFLGDLHVGGYDELSRMEEQGELDGQLDKGVF
eukprot:TRINITY_DN1699_c0_g1_i1.p1 TRINITY_DN1699_c0_g1~~TRINITY_DN1699_c0_g1_i1.p1  ORF type:complete len:138 (-),score=25.42 TRINITY_DN1699_c0_g1_i1:31-444(-)